MTNSRNAVSRGAAPPALALLVAQACWPAPAAAAQAEPQAPLSDLWSRMSAPGCGGGPDPDDIVVCGRRDDPDRYRVAPSARGSVYGRGAARGDLPHTSAEADPTAPCGIFEGERRCGRAEMRAYGYHGGRDPLTAVSRLVEALVEPD